MAFAKIVDGVNITWKNSTVNEKYRKLFFHYDEIELLMRQKGATAITIKNAVIGRVSYNVIVAVTERGLQGYDVLLNKPGNLMAFSCPKAVIPGYSAEIDITKLPKETVEISRPDYIEKTVKVLDYPI